MGPQTGYSAVATSFGAEDSHSLGQPQRGHALLNGDLFVRRIWWCDSLIEDSRSTTVFSCINNGPSIHEVSIEALLNRKLIPLLFREYDA